MRLNDDMRKSVVFLGFGDGDNFTPVGTAFLFGYKDGLYIVTTQHIAVGIGDAPFSLRVNKFDGTSETIPVDPLVDAKWYSHPSDPNVDISVMPYHYRLDKRVFDTLQIHEGMVASDATLHEWGIGAGEMCYVVGLFRLMAGRKRNLPIVHTGNIASLPNDELIPVRDWLAPQESGKARKIQGYLVEVSNLQGLSGSPVLVRPDVVLGEHKVRGNHSVKAYAGSVFLLGIWQGSWDAEPDQVVAIEQRKPVRVPVGMGVVVPADRLIEIMESSQVVEERQTFMRDFEEKLAIAADLDDIYRKK
jgi:hypothetical protein